MINKSQSKYKAQLFAHCHCISYTIVQRYNVTIVGEHTPSLCPRRPSSRPWGRSPRSRCTPPSRPRSPPGTTRGYRGPPARLTSGQWKVFINYRSIFTSQSYLISPPAWSPTRCSWSRRIPPAAAAQTWRRRRWWCRRWCCRGCRGSAPGPRGCRTADTSRRQNPWRRRTRSGKTDDNGEWYFTLVRSYGRVSRDIYRDSVDVRFMAGEGLLALALSNVP